jgi:hypothetical protein
MFFGHIADACYENRKICLAIIIKEQTGQIVCVGHFKL